MLKICKGHIQYSKIFPKIFGLIFRKYSENMQNIPDIILVLQSPYSVIVVVKNMQKYAKYAAKFAFRLLKNAREATRACVLPATPILTLGVQKIFHL